MTIDDLALKTHNIVGPRMNSSLTDAAEPEILLFLVQIFVLSLPENVLPTFKSWLHQGLK